MTVSMLLLSLETWWWPLTLEFSAFGDVTEILSAPFVALFMLIVGLIRAMALLLNGHAIRGQRVGPLLRSIMAVFCASMWTQFAFALLQASITQGRPSPGLPFWIMFVFSELYIAYKAVRRNA